MASISYLDLATRVVDLALAKGLTITTAESCTGGLVSAAITSVPGSSRAFERGFVTYSNAAKMEMLGVSGETLVVFGAVSEAVAQEMARGAQSAASADIAVAITGIAGPGGSEFKPEGRVCFAISSANGTKTETIEFGAAGRANVRAKAAEHALKRIEADILLFEK